MRQSFVTCCAIVFSGCGSLNAEDPALEANSAVDFQPGVSGLLYLRSFCREAAKRLKDVSTTH